MTSIKEMLVKIIYNNEDGTSLTTNVVAYWFQIPTVVDNKIDIMYRPYIITTDKKIFFVHTNEWHGTNLVSSSCAFYLYQKRLLRCQHDDKKGCRNKLCGFGHLNKHVESDLGINDIVIDVSKKRNPNIFINSKTQVSTSDIDNECNIIDTVKTYFRASEYKDMIYYIDSNNDKVKLFNNEISRLPEELVMPHVNSASNPHIQSLWKIYYEMIDVIGCLITDTHPSIVDLNIETLKTNTKIAAMGYTGKNKYVTTEVIKIFSNIKLYIDKYQKYSNQFKIVNNASLYKEFAFWDKYSDDIVEECSKIYKFYNEYINAFIDIYEVGTEEYEDLIYITDILKDFIKVHFKNLALSVYMCKVNQNYGFDENYIINSNYCVALPEPYGVIQREIHVEGELHTTELDTVDNVINEDSAVADNEHIASE
jgi:hypothetical protein